jgi:hypothetical protein
MFMFHHPKKNLTIRRTPTLRSEGSKLWQGLDKSRGNMVMATPKGVAGHTYTHNFPVKLVISTRRGIFYIQCVFMYKFYAHKYLGFMVGISMVAWGYEQPSIITLGWAFRGSARFIKCGSPGLLDVSYGLAEEPVMTMIFVDLWRP